MNKKAAGLEENGSMERERERESGGREDDRKLRSKRVREAGESVVASCRRGDSVERLLILNPHRAFENYQSSYHRRRAAYANCCGVERLNGKLLDSIFPSSLLFLALSLHTESLF